jgi:hypothetical protein
MPADIVTGLEAVDKLESGIGIIAKHAARLKADPDHAAADLAEALDEIEKSCRALDDAIRKYLDLGFKKDALSEGSELLLEVGGGGLLISVKKGLGSCRKMCNIYWNDIDRWFERVFKDDGSVYQELRSVFDELCNAVMTCSGAWRWQRSAFSSLRTTHLGCSPKTSTKKHERACAPPSPS